MLSAITIAVLSFVGMIMSFLKLPITMQYLLKRYHLFTDLLIFVFTYITITAISKTIVGLMSATLIAFMGDLAIRFLKLSDEDPEVRFKLNRRVETTRAYVITTIKRVL